MHDQLEDFRQLVRQRAAFGSAADAAAPLVVVGGGQAGVGTTTIAVNLAVALARQGRRAVFVDADLQRGGKGLFGSQATGSLLDVLTGRRTVHEVLHRGPSGIQLLAGGWTASDVAEFSPQTYDRLIASLRQLAPHAEVLVVDAGNGRGLLARQLWQAAGAVLGVTTPDDSAVVRCYAAIKLHLAATERRTVHTLVNRAPDAALAADVQSRLHEACRRFLSLAVVVAGFTADCDEAAAPAWLFPPRSDAGRLLDRLADTLCAQLQLDGTTATLAGSRQAR